MFLFEVLAGLAAGSASLQADALDFLSDAANYSVSLFVVGMALRHRARASFLKGAAMGLVGLWVLGNTLWHVLFQTLPHAETMGLVGMIALFANGTVLALLWVYRSGDSNMRSVWICSRNDVLGNLAVLLAALGVFGTGTGWPDVIVAATMAGLALQGAWQITRHALRELQTLRINARATGAILQRKSTGSESYRCLRSEKFQTVSDVYNKASLLPQAICGA